MVAARCSRGGAGPQEEERKEAATGSAARVLHCGAARDPETAVEVEENPSARTAAAARGLSGGRRQAAGGVEDWTPGRGRSGEESRRPGAEADVV